MNGDIQFDHEVIDINQVKLRLVENFKLVFKAEINFDSN